MKLRKPQIESDRKLIWRKTKQWTSFTVSQQNKLIGEDIKLISWLLIYISDRSPTVAGSILKHLLIEACVGTLSKGANDKVDKPKHAFVAYEAFITPWRSYIL